MDKEIQMFIRRLRRRLSLQKTIDTLPVFLFTGFFIAFLHVLFGYFRPFYYVGTIGLFWILASFFCGVIYLLLHFPKEQEAAHTGDRAIGQERLLTALELRGNDGIVPRLQKEDTLAHILTCNIREAFPYHIPPKQALACFFAVCLFFIFLFLPSGAKSEAEKLHEIKQEAKTEAIRMETIKKDLEKGTLEEFNAYGKTKKDKIAELLTKAKEEYSSADSKQELQKAKERLNLKLSQMAKKAGSDKEQDAISTLMERAGLSPYNSASGNSASDTSVADNERLDNNRSDNDPLDHNDYNSDSNYNDDNPTSDNNSSGDNSSKDNSSRDNASGDDSSSNGASGNDSSGNNASGGNTSNDNASKNKTSKNNSSSDSHGDDDNKNNHANNSKGNASGDNTQDSNKTHNSSGSGESSGEGQSSQQGNSQNSSKETGKGKNHGSKKGVEYKNKTTLSKEKIVVINEDAIGKDENLTGAASQDGSSHMESSDKQLSFGKKENLEDVVGNYAMDAYTAIDNNSVPPGMEEIVRTYFDIF